MSKKEKDKTIFWRHIIKNNLFMLEIAGHITPKIVVIPLISNIIYAVLNFYTYTFLLRYVINGFQEERGLLELIISMVALYGTRIYSYIWRSARITRCVSQS